MLRSNLTLHHRLESVLVCGGGSRMKGLDTRLLRELTAAAPATVRPVRPSHAACCITRL